MAPPHIQFTFRSRFLQAAINDKLKKKMGWQTAAA
jgi:hypothetical protein